MKERLTKLIKEAQERYIYAEEQAQYLIDNGVDCVNHGEWILEYGDYGKMICSVCKKTTPTERKPDPYEDFQITEFYIESPFCPNCGAKMKGGGEE